MGRKRKHPPSAPPHRKRGGQPGNANHLKHGFYSPRFLPFEKKALDQVPITDLQAEIEALRVFMRRYLEVLGQEPASDPESARRSLVTVCLAVSHMASMVRIQSRGSRYSTESRAIEAWKNSLPSSFAPEEKPPDLPPGEA